jgi:hypothetical protein
MKHFDLARWGKQCNIGGRINQRLSPLVRRCRLCRDWTRTGSSGFCDGGCKAAEDLGEFLSMAGAPDLCGTVGLDRPHISDAEDELKEVNCSSCSPTEIESHTEDARQVPSMSARDPDEADTQEATNFVTNSTENSQPALPIAQPLGLPQSKRGTALQADAPNFPPSGAAAIDSLSTAKNVRYLGSTRSRQSIRVDAGSTRDRSGGRSAVGGRYGIDPGSTRFSG